MSTTTAPSTSPVPAAADSDVTHLTCCHSDGRLSLCGLDVSDHAWTERVNPCVVCVDLEPGPHCPMHKHCEGWE